MPPKSSRSARAAVVLAATLIATTACSPDSDVQRADDDATGSATPDTQVVNGVALPVELCNQIPDDTDSLDFTGAQYSSVPNGRQTGSALAFAVTWPDYVATWTRPRHDSWFIVGVSGGMVELQQLLDTQFPGARVLAMNVTWNEQQLGNLMVEVQTALAEVDGSATVSWSVTTGRVTVDATDVDDDLAEALTPYADLPVCVNVVGG